MRMLIRIGGEKKNIPQRLWIPAKPLSCHPERSRASGVPSDRSSSLGWEKRSAVEGSAVAFRYSKRKLPLQRPKATAGRSSLLTILLLGLTLTSSIAAESAKDTPTTGLSQVNAALQSGQADKSS